MRAAPNVLWRPNPGPQTRFLASPADEVLYGGAAGGGKSAALIALPLRWVHHPRFRALILRRETPQLRDLWDKAAALYPALGATPNITAGTWTFPSGARVWLTHCEHETDIARFDGHELQLAGFDELTHFTERQYRGVRARLRTVDADLPTITRCTTNPGGSGHEWVYRRFGAWLDPQHKRPAKPGERRWYIGDDEAERDTVDALSRTFIPARLSDNPHVDERYRAQLRDLDPVRRAQLLEGDWTIRPSAGLYFPAARWTLLDARPAVARWCRAWDLAATADGDWTVGVLLGHAPTLPAPWIVADVVRFRGGPAEVRTRVAQTAATDPRGTIVCVPQDPGQAGLAQANDFTRLLAGHAVRTRRPTGDKVTRAAPFSAQVAAGNAAVIRAEWTRAFVDELDGFPEAHHDDQVDAAADAFAELALPEPKRTQHFSEDSYDF